MSASSPQSGNASSAEREIIREKRCWFLWTGLVVILIIFSSAARWSRPGYRIIRSLFVTTCRAIIRSITILPGGCIGGGPPLFSVRLLGSTSAINSMVAMLPVSRGGIGIAEAMYVLLFLLAGLSNETALALALFMRALAWLFHSLVPHYSLCPPSAPWLE